MCYFFALLFIFFDFIYPMAIPHVPFHSMKTPYTHTAHIETRTIQIKDMKGFYAHLHPSAQPYCPIHGSAIANSRMLKNISHAIDQKNPLFALTYGKEFGLFQMNNQNVEPAKKYIQPTPFVIGRIIGSVASRAIHAESEQQTLVDLLHAESNKPTSKHDARHFIHALIQSTKISGSDEHALYLQGLPHLIMLAYLAKTTKNKNDLCDYLKGLDYHDAPVLKKSFNELLNQEEFTHNDENVIHNILKNLENEKNVIQENLPFLIKPLLDDSYEQLIYSITRNPPLKLSSKVQDIMLMALGHHHSTTAITSCIDYDHAAFKYLSVAANINQIIHFLLCQKYDNPESAATTFCSIIEQHIPMHPSIEKILEKLTTKLDVHHKPRILEAIARSKKKTIPTYLAKYLSKL